MPALNHLYVVTGMPAVGKSTFARELARRTKACLIDIDTATETIIRAAMSKLTGDPNERDSPTFKNAFRDPIYQTLFSIADENLPHTHAILTGPFTSEQRNPNWPAEILANLKTHCIVKCVHLHCDAALRKQRLIERENPRDASKLENWDQHLKYYEPESFPSYPHLCVDTGMPDSFAKAVSQGLLD